MGDCSNCHHGPRNGHRQCQPTAIPDGYAKLKRLRSQEQNTSGLRKSTGGDGYKHTNDLLLRPSIAKPLPSARPLWITPKHKPNRRRQNHLLSLRLLGKWSMLRPTAIKLHQCPQRLSMGARHGLPNPAQNGLPKLDESTRAAGM